MSNDREISIVITAKNMSAAELEKARLALAGFKKDAEGSAGATSSLGSALRSASSLAGALGVGLGIGAVARFGKALLDDADALVKLSDKTGIAIEPLQQLKFAAEQSGNTLDDVTRGVSMLQARLGDENKDAIGALNKLGLAFEDLRTMNPDQQFMAIAREIAKVEDPMQRAAIATDLFGKSGKELLPTLISHIDDLAAAAPKMSAAAVRAFDDVGDAAARAWSTVKNTIGEGLSSMFDGYSRLASVTKTALSGQGLEAVLTTWADLAPTLERARGTLPPLRVGMTSVALSMDEAADVGKDLDASLRKIRDTTTKASAAQKTWLDSVRDLGFVLDFQQKGLGNLNNITVTGTGLLERYADEIGNLASSDLPRMYEALGAAGNKIETVSLDTEEAAQTFREKFGPGVGKAVDVLNLLSRTAEMSGHKTTAAILSAGSAIAQAFASGGVWGAAITGIGLAVTALWNKFGKGGERSVNDMRDAFIASAGGLHELNVKAVAAGATLSELLNAKTVTQYNTAVKELNTVLEKTATLQGELATLQGQLADRSKLDWQKADELATKYGGTLASLGTQFEGAKLHDSFKTLWDDWQTLTDMGADTGAVLSIMSDEIGGFVAEALRLGTEVPAQFKPFIEELMRSGQLLDANGNAITDLTAIKFGAPLVSEVDKIVSAIDKLVAALTDHLIPTLGSIPSELRVKVGYDYEDYAGRGGVVGPRSETSEFPRHAAGALITSPHLAMVGEGGAPELIGPVGFMADALAGAIATLGRGRAPTSAAPDIVFRPQIVVDGRQVAEAMAPYLPSVLKQYGLVRT